MREEKQTLETSVEEAKASKPESVCILSGSLLIGGAR